MSRPSTRAPKRKRVADTPSVPLTDDEAERAGDEAWGREQKPPPLPGRAHVAEVEREALPAADAPLLAWFERMPAPCAGRCSARSSVRGFARALRTRSQPSRPAAPSPRPYDGERIGWSAPCR